MGRCECCDAEEAYSAIDSGQLLCTECAAIDLGALRAVAAANASAATAQVERRAAAVVELQSERLTKTACGADGTRLTCSVCLDSMRAGQSVG